MAMKMRFFNNMKFFNVFNSKFAFLCRLPFMLIGNLRITGVFMYLHGLRYTEFCYTLWLVVPAPFTRGSQSSL